MNSIKNYIRSCFNMGIDVDAKQYSKNGKLKLLDKREYSIYITPIPFKNLRISQKECIEFVEKATIVWSQILNNGISFKIVDTTFMADIKVYWGKETINKSGVCVTERWSSRNMQNVTIGLMDINGKEYQPEDIFKIILHEFGHIVGLGHSENKNDIMCPHWSNVFEPSTNDKLILKLIYLIGNNSYYDSVHFINNYLTQNANNNHNNEEKIEDNDNKTLEKNILIELEDLGNINKYKLITQSIDLLNHKLIPSFLYKTIWE